MLLPGCDATFERVSTGNDADRVYVLSLEGRRCFYWMQVRRRPPRALAIRPPDRLPTPRPACLQEPDASKDEDNVKRLKELIADPAAAVRRRGGAGIPAAVAAASGSRG